MRVIQVSLLLVVLAGSTGAEQPIVLTPGTNDTVNADWVGVEGRTYFVQCSMDLSVWLHAPIVEYSMGNKSYGLKSTSPRLFLRLSYTDTPPIAGNAEAMDFDGDGIPSLFEVAIFGTDPLRFDSDGGTSSDGEKYSNPTTTSVASLEVFTPLQ